MTNLTNRVRRGTVSLTLLAASAAFATSSVAGDCSSKQANSSLIQTASYNTSSSNYGSGKTYAKKNKGTIVDAAVATPDLSTLVAAVTAADLAGTLSGDGPFTVFAPTNAAFDALPDGTVETLLKPENKATLTNILTSHVVAGSFEAADVIALAKANGGKAEITTLSGAKLKAKVKNGGVYIKDESGNWGQVTTADVKRNNGVVHIVNQVLLPHSGNS
jgi:uncharacterized surface protein with fasciclin (FAS1) repeats